MHTDEGQIISGDFRWEKALDRHSDHFSINPPPFLEESE